MEVSQKDVQQFISSVLCTGDILEVVQNGQIKWRGSDDPITVPVDDGTTGILYTYTTTPDHPDAVIINPFAEGITASADRNWFYKVMGVIIAKHLTACCDFILKIAISEEPCPYPNMVPYVTAIAGRVDEKTLKEFEYIKANGSDGFCSLVYNSTAKETKLFLGFEDPSGDYQAAIPANKCRKKTWQVFQDLMRAIFQTKCPVIEQYKVSTASLVCPQFRTFIQLWFDVWRAISPIVEAIADNSESDLGANTTDILNDIEPHLERIDVYHKMCQWGTSVNTPKSVKETVSKKSVSAPMRRQAYRESVDPTRFDEEDAPRSEPQMRKRSRWDEPPRDDRDFRDQRDRYYDDRYDRDRERSFRDRDRGFDSRDRRGGRNRWDYPSQSSFDDRDRDRGYSRFDRSRRDSPIMSGLSGGRSRW